MESQGSSSALVMPRKGERIVQKDLARGDFPVRFREGGGNIDIPGGLMLYACDYVLAIPRKKKAGYGSPKVGGFCRGDGSRTTISCFNCRLFTCLSSTFFYYALRFILFVLPLYIFGYFVDFSYRK